MATAASATPSTSTIVNGVHGKCGVVNSLTKFCDATHRITRSLDHVLTRFEGHAVELPDCRYLRTSG